MIAWLEDHLDAIIVQFPRKACNWKVKTITLNIHMMKMFHVMFCIYGHHEK